MGNTTTRQGRSPVPSHSTEVVDSPARIGHRLAAQRVEIFSLVGDADTATLVGAWSAFACKTVTPPTRVPLTWFPWSLGNVRAREYLFVCNAGSLPYGPSGSTTVSDLGMASVLHLPVSIDAPRGRVTGAACAYWSSERVDWPSESRELVCSWAAEVLSAAS